MPPKRRGRKAKRQSNTLDAEKKYFIDHVTVEYQGELAKVKALKDQKLAMLHQVVALVKKRIPSEFGNMKKKDLKYDEDREASSQSSCRRRSSSLGRLLNEVPKSKRVLRSSSCGPQTRGYMFQTPAGCALGKSLLITPKVNLNSPVAMLRYAQKGELAVSTSGSPLLVTGNALADTVNINVPLNDGKVVSLFPNSKMETKNISNKLDRNIRQQLTVLTHTLKSILGKGQE